MAKYRYPGIQPFRADEEHIFFGRDKDIETLYRTLRQQPITVLYSKSGLGKSSLLNAGLLPYSKDRDEFDPVVIRFGAWSDPAQGDPISVTGPLLVEGVKEKNVISRMMPDDRSLWALTKQRHINLQKRPLIIFDQFEELFTYPAEMIRAFALELSELVYTELPLRYRRLLETSDEITESEEDALDEPMRPAVLFAIRSDRMHLMHKLSGYLRGVLGNLFELDALSVEDAKKAILQPAALPQDGAYESFTTPPFNWESAALEQLLAYLQTDSEQGRVEGILLQMLCREYEEQLVAGKGLTTLQAADLGDFDTIIARYYASRVGRLGDSEQKARVFIEEGLILEGENIRLTLHQAQIFQQFGIDQALLDQLVDSRLLRAEPFLRGGYTYELAHDRLVEPILEAKHQRQQQQKQVAEEAARQEAEMELAEERKKRQRARRIAIFSTALSLIALIALAVAIWQFQIASQKEQEALDRQQEAQQELCNALSEKRKRLLSEVDQLRKEATTFEKAGETAYQELRLVQADSLIQEVIVVEQGMKPCE